MGIWLGPRGQNTITAEDFSYTGSYLFTTDSSGHWEAALLTSGVLRFGKNPGKIDLFMVAGGQTAPAYSGSETRNAWSGPAIGDPGGRGGELVTVRSLSIPGLTDFSVVIGGSDQNTSFSGSGVSLTAQTALGKNGGVGGRAESGSATAAGNGEDGDYAYGEETDTLLFSEDEFPGHLFGPGGGGGAARYRTANWTARGIGGESNGDEHQYGRGGLVYQYEQYPNGSAGFANHGQGGGGAAYYWLTSGGGASRVGESGAGGSGIMFIRGAR